jgi:hypothetical protein
MSNVHRRPITGGEFSKLQAALDAVRQWAVRENLEVQASMRSVDMRIAELHDIKRSLIAQRELEEVQ